MSETCPRCGSTAYIAGYCIEGSHPGVERRGRRERKPRACVHRRWLKARNSGPYAGREVFKCARCGVERAVEV